MAADKGDVGNMGEMMRPYQPGVVEFDSSLRGLKRQIPRLGSSALSLKTLVQRFRRHCLELAEMTRKRNIVLDGSDAIAATMQSR